METEQWTERNLQRWALEFLPAFQVYWSETQIRACRDPRMNLETGSSFVTVALDMHCTTGIQPPAHGGRRGLGIVNAWAKNVEHLDRNDLAGSRQKGKGAEKDNN